VFVKKKNLSKKKLSVNFYFIIFIRSLLHWSLWAYPSWL